MESNDLFIYLFVCLFFISPTFQMHYLSILVFSYSFFFIDSSIRKDLVFARPITRNSIIHLFLYFSIQLFKLSTTHFIQLLLFTYYYYYYYLFFILSFFPFFSFFFVVLLVLLIYRLPIQRTGCGISLRQLREHKQCWKG